MAVKEKMTAIADEVRLLSNTTQLKNLDAIANDLQSANNEINEQAILLEWALTALQDKASPSAPSPTPTYPTLTNPGTAKDLFLGKQLIDGNGNIVFGTNPYNADNLPQPQVFSGSLRTDSIGEADVACGFVPDLVILHLGSYSTEYGYYENQICCSFEHRKTGGDYAITSCSYDNSGKNLYEMYFYPNDNISGFWVQVYKKGALAVRETINFTAVKYINN